jgi:luciferase family oxidoreductase group 1
MPPTPVPERSSTDHPITGRLPLSVLDLAIVSAGSTSADALAATTTVAQRADALGYARFWVAEHHNMPSVASTSPPVLMAHLAASTPRIRVGSGGIMLPNHPPLVVAEHLAALEALHPGRIDLGIGRAPGTDQRTAAALRRSPAQLGVEEFPADLLDVMAMLGDPRSDEGMHLRFRATPAATTSPQIVLLGSSGNSAQLAGMLGLRFAFANHYGTGGTREAVALYRRHFTPSPVLDAPHLIVTANVLVADTDEAAQFEAGPGRLMTQGIRRGRFEPLRSPDDAAAVLAAGDPPTPRPRDPSAHPLPSRIVGTPDAAVAALDELVAATDADELMVSTVAYDTATRVRSLELLADAWHDRSTSDAPPTT